MEEITTIGLDIAKSVFQVHGIDASGAVIVRRQLRRRQVLPFFRKLPACVIGIEACATSHHWARELENVGHEVRLMPARYVKPYVKRNKNDAADAEAICEAVQRPTMFGIVAGIGRNGVEKLLGLIAEGEDERIPSAARECLMALAAQLELVKRQVLEADRRVLAWHRASKLSRRLEAIPGVGLLIATALVASIPDPNVFRSGRDLSAWIGLVPKQNSTGGKERLGSISKAGQPVSALVTRRWRPVGHQASQTVGLYPSSLARHAHGAPVRQDRRYRTGQQDCPHRLGADVRQLNSPQETFGR